MNRLLLASLSTLVLTAIAAPQARAIAPESSSNFVQQVINHNEELRQEQAQEPQLQSPKAEQPMIKSHQTNSMGKGEKNTAIESLGFEYFERQYLDRYGS